MDYCFQIVATAPSHDAAFKWQVGDIVSIKYAADVATFKDGEYTYNAPIATTKNQLAFVFILDLPQEDINELKHLTAAKLNGGGSVVTKRDNFMDTSLAPSGMMTKIGANKQATETWTSSKTFLKNKTSGELLQDKDV